MTPQTNKTSIRTTLLASAAALPLFATSQAAFAQCQQSLLFSTKAAERSEQAIAGGEINTVRRNSLQIVQPRPTSPFTSAAYMPRAGYDTLLGDGDADGDFTEMTLFGGVDAVMQPRLRGGAFAPTQKTSVFFSTETLTTDTYGGQIAPGDIGRILPGGRIESFITAAMIRAAFNIPVNEPINVDAAAMHFRGLPNGAGDLYLSLEDSEFMIVAPIGGVVVSDGAILRIPAGAMTFVQSPHDNALLVTACAPGGGELVMFEFEVDARTANAGMKDAAGMPVMSVGDVDGLTVDPAGGLFQTPTASFPVPHLWFSGENLTGGAILSTAGGGSIPTLNGVPLARAAAATDGRQVGLFTPAGVESLNGIALAACGTSHFSLDTPTPSMGGGAGVLEVEVGGSTGGGVLLLAQLGCNTVGCVDVGVAFPTPDYSALVAGSLFAIVPTGADGCGTLALPLPAFIVAGFAGQNILFQAFDPATGGHLSNPVRIAF